MSERPRRGKRFIFVLALWALMLAAGEVGLRLFDRARGMSLRDHLEMRGRKYAYHPHLGHSLVPGHDGPGSGRRLHVNRLGYRGAEVEVPKPAGTFRVLCLGGSTTFAPQLADTEAWPSRLEQVLRERHPGRAIEVVNGGADAYTSAESLIDLELNGLDLEPDLVVVLHGINDLRASWFDGFRADYRHYPKLWARTLIGEELVRYHPWRRRLDAWVERSLL
jgi:hypothetical protein